MSDTPMDGGEQSVSISSDFAIVALLDALGTKGVLDRAAPEGLFDDWRDLLDYIDTLCAGARQMRGCESCSWLAFSDTVVIVLVPQSEAAFPRMLASMGYILQGALWAGMRRGVFLRGAASVGRFLQWDTRMLGESLEEAASWYELPDWIGVIATPSLGHLLDENVQAGHAVEDYFVGTQVPLKGIGQRRFWAVNWPARAALVERDVGRDAHIQLLRWFRTYGGAVGPKVADKYANTLAFARGVWADMDGMGVGSADRR